MSESNRGGYIPGASSASKPYELLPEEFVIDMHEPAIKRIVERMNAYIKQVIEEGDENE